MAKPLQSVWTLYRESYELVKRNLNLFIFLYSIPALVALWNFLEYLDTDSSLRDDTGPGYSALLSGPWGVDAATPVAASVTLSIIIFALSIILTLLQTIAVFEIAQRRTTSLRHVWERFKAHWLWLRLLALMIVLGVLLILGFIALIIPGVIFLWRFFLAPYIMLDKNTSIPESIVQSWERTRGLAGPIYAVIGVFILISVVAFLPLLGPVISFLLTVAFSVVPALRYFEIKHHRSHAS